MEWMFENSQVSCPCQRLKTITSNSTSKVSPGSLVNGKVTPIKQNKSKADDGTSTPPQKPIVNGGIHSHLNGGSAGAGSPKINGSLPTKSNLCPPSSITKIATTTTTNITTNLKISHNNGSNLKEVCTSTVPNCQNYYYAHSCSHQGKC